MMFREFVLSCVIFSLVACAPAQPQVEGQPGFPVVGAVSVEGTADIAVSTTANGQTLRVTVNARGGAGQEMEGHWRGSLSFQYGAMVVDCAWLDDTDAPSCAARLDLSGGAAAPAVPSNGEQAPP